MTHLTHANSLTSKLALARIRRLGLERVGVAAGESVPFIWPPNGTLTAIGFCCVLCVVCCMWQGALLQRVTWQEYKQHKARQRVARRGWWPHAAFEKQCKGGGCMRWRNWFLNSVPPCLSPPLLLSYCKESQLMSLANHKSVKILLLLLALLLMMPPPPSPSLNPRVVVPLSSHNEQVCCSVLLCCCCPNTKCSKGLAAVDIK